MSFLGFIGNYADEALGVAKALTTLLDGVAINSAQADSVKATIDRLEKAHSEITKYIAKQPKVPNVVKISQADIDAAVKRYLDAKAKK